MKLTNINEVIKKYNQNFKKANDTISKEDYNELLIAYNDLSDRLSTFLISTGKVPLFPPSLGNYVSEIKTTDNTDSYLINLDQKTANSMEINWGDGTIEQSGTETHNIDMYHSYATAGSYIITLTNKTEDGSQIYINVITTESTEYAAFNGVKLRTIDSNLDYGINQTLTKLYANNADARIGETEGGAIITAYPSSNPSLFEELIIGNDTATVGGLVQNSETLQKVTIGSGCTQIGYDTTSIFSHCTNPNIEVHFLSTTPPSWNQYYEGNINELFFDADDTNIENIPENFKIYVPTASVNAYKAKDCFSKYADYIVGE